ncbi:putative Cytotoxic translational repressor of toxin-antitoxin stability system [Candidatus Nitrospira nitrosa]|uniref:Putative Cytotoxic translational repressor of toxin-antitoxin stability system n=1 Tax=Candidatus Nitrospira nitrosa TaxID=1742972 RepID=A0A0S4LPK7_9BACT|nr:type II toxin-antitoxin system RelE/ParE family toxin [Candidatus Nitrospira nitrosa]CUS39445.1 putative Cytotoxic translational repressor of toxin-antitoxin stability system [Candidatus Nitrospira nitrosa]
MISFRPDIPPHVAAVIRTLHPDIKQLIKSAIRAIAADPECGEPLKRELDGLRKYRARRFRVVYAVDHKRRVMSLMAVGHRRSVYEELTERILRKPRT